MWQLTTKQGKLISQHETLKDARTAKHQHWTQTGAWPQIGPSVKPQEAEQGTGTIQAIREVGRLVAGAALCFAALC